MGRCVWYFFSLSFLLFFLISRFYANSTAIWSNLLSYVEVTWRYGSIDEGSVSDVGSVEKKRRGPGIVNETEIFEILSLSAVP